MGKHLDITREQLQSAWLQRRRSDWPATFDAVMADPMLRRLVRAIAVGRAQAQRRMAQAPFDARRAAANDLKDSNA
jgi:hypothetical protein